MDDTKDIPKVFANRMIQQLIEHSLGEEAVVSPADYLIIRQAFRNMGGSWEQISLGHPKAIETLKSVVTTWSQDPKRQKHNNGFV